MKKILSLALSLALVLSVAAVAGISASAEGETVVKTLYSFENGTIESGVTLPNNKLPVFNSSTTYAQTGNSSLEFIPYKDFWNMNGVSVTSKNSVNKIRFEIPTGLNITGEVGFYLLLASCTSSDFSAWGVELENGDTYYTKFTHFGGNRSNSEKWMNLTLTGTKMYKLDDDSTTFTPSTENFSDSAADDQHVVAMLFLDAGRVDKDKETSRSYIDNVYYETVGGVDTPTTPDISKIEMLPGAALRIDGTTEGIRFDATVNTAELKDYTNSVSAIAEMGMLVAKEEYATLDNMILANAKESNETNANVETNVVKAIYAEDVTLGTYDETHNSIIGSLVEIKEENTAKNYVARAYIKFKNGEETYSPTLSDARSVAYVANEFMNDKSADYAELCDEHKALISGWAAKLNTETREIILDWSKFNGYSEGGFTFKKDEPTGYIHVTGDKTLSDKTSVAELLNWWGWTAEGYDKIQFTAYTASGSCNIRMYFDGKTTATTTISTEPTVVTYDVTTAQKGDVKFQLDAGTKGATVSVNLYIGDVYGIKTN